MPFALGHRPALDGIRGVAIALVVLVHFTAAVPALRPHVQGGFIGVEMFFVLSGFLITSLVLDEIRATGDVKLRSFYRRRGLRLFPALCLMVIVCITLGALQPIARFGPTPDQLVVAAASLLYVMNVLTAVLPARLPIWSQPLWSLCVEVHFYLLWPPLLGFVAKRHRAALPWLAGGVIVASVAFRITTFVVVGAPYQTILTPARFDGLAVGALTAIALHSGWRPSPRLPGLGAAGLCVLGAMTLIARPSSAWMVVFGYSLVNVTTAAVLVDALEGRSVTARVLAVTPLRRLGEWSYALYLWHIPVYFILGTRIASTAILVPLAVVTALLVAGASSTFFEMPLRRLGQRRRAEPVAPAGVRLQEA